MESISLKAVALGDAGCGKTSLLSVFSMNETLDGNTSHTLQNEVINVEVDGTEFALYLCNTAGVEEHNSVFRKETYENTDVFLMCFSIDNQDSLENIEMKWWPEVHSVCPKVPIVLVGNKKDLELGKDTTSYQAVTNLWLVKTKDCHAMAKKIGAFAYLECSAKQNDGVNEVFDMAFQAIFQPTKKKWIKKKEARLKESIPTIISKKVVAVGDAGCGKTSLLIALSTDKVFDEKTPHTLENEVMYVEIDGKNVELSFCSTAGHEERFDFLRQLTYQSADVFLMCFSVDNPDSMQNIESKWMREVRHFCPKVPIVLVGNKKDTSLEIEDRKDDDTESNLCHIRTEDGLTMGRRIGACAYLECSAKLNDGVKEVFEMALGALSKKKKGKLSLSRK